LPPSNRNDQVIQYSHDLLDRTTAEQWYDSAGLVPSLSISTDTDGGTSDEVQRVGFTADWISGGTFTLTVSGEATSELDAAATAMDVQIALEALSTVGSGNVVVTKLQDVPSAQEWQLTFQGAKAGDSVVQTTIDSSNIQTVMDPPSDIQLTDIQGGITTNEVHTVTLSNANGGTFHLAFVGETTIPIAFDGTGADVEFAIEELNAVDQVTVTGASGGPWTVTFVGTHSATNVFRMDGDVSASTNGNLIRTINYAFDAANQLTSASDPDSSYAYTYDDLGRLLTVDNAGTAGAPAVVLTSTFDANNNRTGLSATIAATVDFQNTYTYDSLNRLTRLDQSGPAGGNEVAEKRVEFAYNAIDQFTMIARFNDTDGGASNEIATATYSYDAIGRLTRLDYTKGGVDLFSPYSWTYDNLHRIAQFTSQDGTSDYTYDTTDQLTAAVHSYQTNESYSYDANGNRTMSGYTTGVNNQLLNDGTYSYEYDDEGNRTKRTNDTTGDVTEYEWDFQNRLTKVTERDESDATTLVVEYRYDVFDRRISRAVDTASPFDLQDAAITGYVYGDANGVTSDDGGNVVLDFIDDDGIGGSNSFALAARQLFGTAVDQILAQEDTTRTISSSERVMWHLVDNVGTSCDLANNNATIATHFQYDAFGGITVGNMSLTRYLYTSREYDNVVRLQSNRARWYDGAVGRWTAEDPLGFDAGDANLVRYVGNAPVSFRDSSGLFTWGGKIEIAEIWEEGGWNKHWFGWVLQLVRGGHPLFELVHASGIIGRFRVHRQGLRKN
jgi:RHS repeat-associated protein